MALRKLDKDPESPNGGSPITRGEGQLPRAGGKVEDAERLGQMDIPGHQSVVEIPRRMVKFFLEVQKDDEDPDV